VEEKLLRESISRFVEEKIIPRSAEIDENNSFPYDMFHEIAEMGMYGIRYPATLGGADAGTVMFCILCEELARGNMSIAANTAMQCLMGTDFIFRYGTQKHIETLLIPAIRGEKIAAFALTEPGSGTDLGSVRTTAKKNDGGWIISGNKTWITNATTADFFTVLAQTYPEKGLKGLDFFLVPGDTPGLIRGKKFDKLGTRATEISEITLDECHIPRENRLGEEGAGVTNLLNILAEIRVMTGALSLGLARAAYESSVKYAKERIAFGRPIAKFQAIQMKLANMATEIEASRLLVYDAARKMDEGKECIKGASMAKYFASETACRTVDEATRIFGAYGYSMEYPAQRFFRDARFLLYGGGTSEILQTIIAREILRE
jgi:alkylation response protein AidB-like acyl-CoA dehydrogenase